MSSALKADIMAALKADRHRTYADIAKELGCTDVYVGKIARCETGRTPRTVVANPRPDQAKRTFDEVMAAWSDFDTKAAARSILLEAS